MPVLALIYKILVVFPSACVQRVLLCSTVQQVAKATCLLQMDNGSYLGSVQFSRVLFSSPSPFKEN